MVRRWWFWRTKVQHRSFNTSSAVNFCNGGFTSPVLWHQLSTACFSQEQQSVVFQQKPSEQEQSPFCKKLFTKVVPHFAIKPCWMDSLKVTVNTQKKQRFEFRQRHRHKVSGNLHFVKICAEQGSFGDDANFRLFRLLPPPVLCMRAADTCDCFWFHENMFGSCTSLMAQATVLKRSNYDRWMMLDFFEIDSKQIHVPAWRHHMW